MKYHKQKRNFRSGDSTTRPRQKDRDECSLLCDNLSLCKSLLALMLFSSVVACLLFYDATFTSGFVPDTGPVPSQQRFKPQTPDAIPNVQEVTSKTTKSNTYPTSEAKGPVKVEIRRSTASSNVFSDLTLINGRNVIPRKNSNMTRNTRYVASNRAVGREQQMMVLIQKTKLDWVANNLPFPLDVFKNRYTDGHRVKQLCKLGRVETLFFFHTAPDHKEKRDFYRSTIAHLSLASFYNWTAVFFVGTRPNINLTAEGYRNGDIVQLPFVDVYRNLTYKFVYGMRWTLLNCPTAQIIVKLDDDVFVNPPVLSTYIRRYMNVREMSIHCSVYKHNIVIRNPNSRHYLSVREYPSLAFPPHCHGWAILFPAWVMYPLYKAAFHVPMHAIDDAYVTGDLVLKTGIGHRDISVLMSNTENRLLETAQGQFIFSLFSGKRKLSLHKLLWKTLVQMRHEPRIEAVLDRTLV
ncbi:uncharacterized protein LOC135367940 [Ornithodoros turicata]|uniref:uncharacterized protein LOC135367940 n=1 Tax=Ornithodoros turicata TaxID=34597 RepID=UPI003139CF36